MLKIASYIKNFLSTNGLLLIFGIVQYFLLNISFGFLSICTTFFTLAARNFLLVKLINHRIADKENIGGDSRTKPIETYKGEFILDVFKGSAVETILMLCAKQLFFKNSNGLNIMHDLLYFIPISFMFEIIFDFFHYVSHRLLHHRYLYKYLHKKHHMHHFPSAITTFCQHPIDIILTNCLPTIITLFLVPQMSYFEFTLIMTYKIYIEICGHTGKIVNACSFPQCIWLPKIFEIELYTTDHDLHHTKNNCNYSKRFVLWDKIFGTFTRK